ncbi:MAG: ABC transporter substrate-binding protein [Pseudomonadota bacterium]
MCRVLLLGLLLVCATAVLGADQRQTVMMILYRGATEAERGFMDYLKSRLPVEFVVRDASADRLKISEFVAEAKRTRPALIYAFGTSVALEVVGAAGAIDPVRHITDIPVVFNIVADPVGARLAPGFVATGRNVTGVSHLVPMATQLKTIQRMHPMKRLGVVYNPHEANSVLAVRELRQQAGVLRFGLVEVPLSVAQGQKPASHEITSAMQLLMRERPDLVYLPSDSSLIQQAGEISGFANTAGIPVVSATEAPIRQHGALMGLVSSYYNAGAYAGYMAEQILTGKRTAGSIPVDTLARFTLLINMKTATRLGIYPPLDLIPIAEIIN